MGLGCSSVWKARTLQRIPLLMPLLMLWPAREWRSVSTVLPLRELVVHFFHSLCTSCDGQDESDS